MKTLYEKLMSRILLEADGGAGGTGTQGDGKTGETDPAKTGKTFTQEEVNEMMGRVRGEGRTAGISEFLKALGAKDETEIKAALEAQRKQAKPDPKKTEEKPEDNPVYLALSQELKTIKEANEVLAQKLTSMETQEQRRRRETANAAILESIRKAGGKKAEHVLATMTAEGVLKDIVKDDGSYEVDKLVKAIDDFKAKNTEYFNRNPGSFGTPPGVSQQPDAKKLEQVGKQIATRAKF